MTESHSGQAIIEYDTSAVKLVDYINRRPLTSETSNCPLIPIIILLGEEEENKLDDVKEVLATVGGANKILTISTPAATMLLTILDIVHNRKRVEDTFRKMKKVRIISSKYPYLPVFGTKTTKTAANASYEPSKSEATSISATDFKMDEIDDVSDVSNFLPSYLLSVSKRNLSTASPPTLRRKDTTKNEDDLHWEPTNDEDKDNDENESSLMEFNPRKSRADSLDSVASATSGNKLNIPGPLSL
jgi:hypothetical protein